MTLMQKKIRKFMGCVSVLILILSVGCSKKNNNSHPQEEPVQVFAVKEGLYRNHMGEALLIKGDGEIEWSEKIIVEVTEGVSTPVEAECRTKKRGRLKHIRTTGVQEKNIYPDSHFTLVWDYFSTSIEGSKVLSGVFYDELFFSGPIMRACNKYAAFTPRAPMIMAQPLNSYSQDHLEFSTPREQDNLMKRLRNLFVRSEEAVVDITELFFEVFSGFSIGIEFFIEGGIQLHYFSKGSFNTESKTLSLYDSNGDENCSLVLESVLLLENSPSLQVSFSENTNTSKDHIVTCGTRPVDSKAYLEIRDESFVLFP